MISKWKVFNFKSIREEAELEFGPITVFAGANSSGKSTLIQSILLISQTVSHKVRSRSVVLNGSLTSLGQFDDLKSIGGEADQILIDCTLRPIPDQETLAAMHLPRPEHGSIFIPQSSHKLQEINFEISFDANPSSTERELLQIQPELFASRLSCIARDKDNVDQHAHISIRRSNKTISEIDGSYSFGIDEYHAQEKKLLC